MGSAQFGRSVAAVSKAGSARGAVLAAHVVALLIAAGPQTSSADSPRTIAWPESYRQDANLFDVCFVNSQLGWAVGDRGTILHTQDGGETWQLQDCPTGARLESVHFIDARRGWAVGGASIAFTHRPAGIVLSTVDGGQTWKEHTVHFLPWLTGVQFWDSQRGVAFGFPSAMYPSAAFYTQDGGEHWTSWPGASTGWVDGWFDDPRQGWLIDRKGQIVRLQQRGLTPTGTRKHDARMPVRIAAGPGPWWLCGNQGLIEVSDDRGENWLAPRGLPDSDVLAEFDWQAVDVIGDRVCVVGVPGSCVLCTEDAGQTWQLNSTGQTLPLYAVEFIDAQQGWAVGALGSILVTRDGGRTWTAQRGAGRRLSVLGIFGAPERVPWEAVAQLAAGEGNWTRIEVLAGSVACGSRPGQTPASTRLHEAAVMLGGVGANLIQSLPAPDDRLQLPAVRLRRYWDQVCQADSAGQLTEYLARQIRTWQPDLVIVAEPAHADDGLNHLARQLVLQAAEQAADAAQYETQLKAGLGPWRVARLTSVSTEPTDNGYAINSAQLISSLGQAVGHLASRARGHVAPGASAASQRMTLRTLDGDASARRGLFAPQRTPDGVVSRRGHDELADGIRQANQHAQRRRNLESLLSETPSDQTAVWQQAMHLAGELSGEHRAELFLNSAARRLQTGQSELAFELLEQVQQFAEPDALREPARLWLFWYLASEEASMHWPLAPQATVQQVIQAGTVASHAGAGPGVTLVSPVGLSDPSSDVVTATGRDDEHAIRQRWQHAQRIAETIQAEQPDLYFEPMLRFPLAAFQRRMGQIDAARPFWRSQLSGRTDPAYRTWAASELALLESEPLLPRACWECNRVDVPPQLDGRLDDATWQSIRPTQLTAVPPRSADEPKSSTRIRLAYDPQFLYLAVEADKAPTLTYTGRDDPRQRDAVADVDRLELYLDVDRDGVTYWHLAVDHRGSGGEWLNADASWNPQWYIAVSEDESSWTVEAAVSLASLCRQPPSSGDCWALGVQRILPGLGWETWLQPAPVEQRPEEFGLLRFQ